MATRLKKELPLLPAKDKHLSPQISHPLVSRIYAIKGKSDPIQIQRIEERSGFKVEWASQIPRSREGGRQKLEEERGILVLVNRHSKFIDRFQHMKGICFPFYKLTAYNNCNFWCEYCYLYMTFYMRPQSIHYINYDNMFAELEQFSASKARKNFQVLNLGELADPLAIDDITGFSTEVIPYAAKLPNVKLLFLTKSDNVQNLIDLDHRGKTILAWSVNSERIAKSLEHRTPSVDKRIEAAKKAQEAGYEVRFRIDPLFYYDGWEKEYQEVIDKIFEVTCPRVITFGAYRPSSGLINHIRARFPKSQLIELDKKLEMDAGKRRFDESKRLALYAYLTRAIAKKNEKTIVALCKEPLEIWKKVGLRHKNISCNCLRG